MFIVVFNILCHGLNLQTTPKTSLYLCPLEVTEVALLHLNCTINGAAVLGPGDMNRLGTT